MSELETRVNKNSGNSSKPPSTDGYKKTIKNSRVKSEMPIGGQFGHDGRTLDKIENPDEVFEYSVPNACECGCNLECIDEQTKNRQVFDIPKIHIRVTEHVTHEKVCL